MLKYESPEIELNRFDLVDVISLSEEEETDPAAPTYTTIGGKDPAIPDIW